MRCSCISMRVGLGISGLDLSMLWLNSCCLWQTVERIVDTDKSAFLEHAHLSVEKGICSRECPRQHYFLSLTFNFQPNNEKLLQESGHTRIVL